MYLFWSRGDWAKEILKGFFLSCVFFGVFFCIRTGARELTLPWIAELDGSNLESGKSFSPSCLCLLLLFSSSALSDFSSSGHSRSISISRGYNKGFTLFQKDYFLFYCFFIKVFLLKSASVFSFRWRNGACWNHQPRYATVLLRILYFVSTFILQILCKPTHYKL